MFSLDFLKQIRSHELDFYKPFLPAGARLLEIGGGTGEQARQLSESGLEVISVDLRDSNYSDKRVFPIVEYDGKKLPFASNSFDVIFSSNALEHIKEIDSFHKELDRVLKVGGFSIHAMPSSTWRLWTNITYYIYLLQRLYAIKIGKMPAGITDKKIRAKHRILTVLNPSLELLRTSKQLFYVPQRHGERGNCLTELYTFSRFYWKRHFRKNNYTSIDAIPMKLFYTGHMVMGNKLSLRAREVLAKFLGSSCILYKIQK